MEGIAFFLGKRIVSPIVKLILAEYTEGASCSEDCPLGQYLHNNKQWVLANFEEIFIEFSLIVGDSRT